jgi:hypothetical protein
VTNQLFNGLIGCANQSNEFFVNWPDVSPVDKGSQGALPQTAYGNNRAARNLSYLDHTPHERQFGEGADAAGQYHRPITMMDQIYYALAQRSTFYLFNYPTVGRTRPELFNLAARYADDVSSGFVGSLANACHCSGVTPRLGYKAGFRQQPSQRPRSLVVRRPRLRRAAAKYTDNFFVPVHEYSLVFGALGQNF